VSYQYSGPLTGVLGPSPIWTVSKSCKFLATSHSYASRDRLNVDERLSVTDLDTGRIVFKVKDSKESANVHFAPDNKTFFNSSNFTLTDLETGRERQLERIATETYVREAQFSPDGKVLVMVYADSMVAWWDLERGGPGVRLPHRHADHSTMPLVFTPDSTQIVMVTGNTEDDKVDLALVNLKSGKIVRSFDAGKTDNLAGRILLLSPDGKQLVEICAHSARGEVKNGKWVVVAADRDIFRRWDIGSGKELPVINASGLATLQFSPDGQILAIAEGSFLRLHEAISGREVRRLPLEVKPSDFQSRLSRTLFSPGLGNPFAFTPDGKTVAIAARRTIRRFEVATGKEIGPAPNSQTILSVAAAKQAKWVASCALDLVQVWDADTQKVIFEGKPWTAKNKEDISLTGVGLSPDGRRLAVGGSDGAVVLFDVITAKQLRKLHFHAAPVTSLVFGHDGATLISSDYNTHVAVWDVVSGELIRKLAPRLAKKDGPWKVFHEWHDRTLVQNSKGGWDSWASSPVLSGDGRLLVIPDGDVIGVCDLSTLKESPTETSRGRGGKVAIAQDGGLLAVVGDDWVVRLVEVGTGTERRAFARLPGIKDCCLSSDGRLLAACSLDGIRLWDTTTGTLLAECNGHRGLVTTVAFSPEGGTLVSAAYDGTMLVWDVASLTHKPAKKELSAEELKTLWDDLASPDAALAGKAMRRLIGSQQAAALLRENLKAASSLPKEDIVKLVVELDDVRPKTRENASKILGELAELAEPGMRARLAAKPSLEQRRRIELLLTRLGEPLADGGKLRALRVVEILELTATPEAVAVLQMLADGAEAAHVTREARAALRRMKQPASYR
jgi:WD40 repeat protein